MRAGCIGALVALLGLWTAAAADLHTIAIGDETAFRVLEQTAETLTFEVRVGELSGVDVTTPAGDFTLLTLSGGHHSLTVGEPALPMINQLCEIPRGAEAQIEILHSSTRVIALADYGIVHPLMPAQPSVPKNVDPATLAFRYDAGAYAPGRIAAREPVLLSDVGQMRAVRIGRLEVAPVSYDPGAGTITVCESLRATVRFVGADRAAELALKQATYSPFFEPIFDRLLAGYRTPHTDHPDLMDGPVKYVIVSARMFEEELQPFIEWKTLQGFRVIEAYTDMPNVGNTTSSIQNYLRDLYDASGPGNPAPTFVLFVGDVNLVPCWQSSGPTDLFYCEYTNDNIPEIYYGRFSAQTEAQLLPQISKTLEYEMATFPDPSYLSEVVMIAGVDPSYGNTYANGQINYGTRHYFNLAHGITSHTYLYPQSGSSGPQIIADVSNGVAFANYTAHGDVGGWSNPSFTNYNIDGLRNEHMYCLAIGNCCLTSKFDSGDCFAEHWLRADRKGAIGYIGAANYSYWSEDYWWGVGYKSVVPSGADYNASTLGAYDGLWHTHSEPIDQWYVVQDALIFCGNLAVVQGGGMISYYWRVYNLMGDPSLSPYLGVPTANLVGHDEFIDPQNGIWPSSLTVTAAPNSYVGVTKNGQLLGSGLIGASGMGTISVFGHGTSGNVHLVVTGQNKYPYAADIPVSNPAAIVGGGEATLLGLRAAPNPLSPDTRVCLNLGRAQQIRLQVHDLSGRVVRTLAEGHISAGQHFYGWDGRDAAGRTLPGGVYLARMQGESGDRAWKIVLPE